MSRRILSLILLLFQCTLWSQSGVETEFGKNRVQHHDDFDDWYLYETQNFVTYWYGKARNVGQMALSLAEIDFKSIENILEHKLNDKIEIICYTDVSDLKQSNIGIDEIFISENDRTTVSGNRIFIYYDGDHRHLRKQIREGVGEVYLNAMIYGSGLSGFVQRSVQLKIPDWFKEGLIGYLGEEWSVKADNQFRDLLQSSSPKKKFETLARDHPRLVGYAFWNYITKEYGKSNVSNILYLARINRNIKSSFLYILGVPFDQIAGSCLDYFRKTYQEDKKVFSTVHEQQALSVKNKKKILVSAVRVSPNGKLFAYAVNDRGRYKIFVQDIRSGKPYKILAGGIKNSVQETDYTIPVFAWNKNNTDLALITEKHDTWWLYNIDVQSGKYTKDKLSPEYQRVYQVDWIDDKTLLLNASTDALADLYTYLPLTRESKRITTDFYDDLNASYGSLMGQKGILFKSNRALDTLFSMPLDTLLPVQPFNLYFMPFDPSNGIQSKKLKRLTDNLYSDLDQPAISGQNQISYLDDESGVKQRKTITLDDAGNIIMKLSSHADHDISAFHAADHTGLEVIQKGRNHWVMKDMVNKPDSAGVNLTVYRQNQIKTQKIAQSDFVPLSQAKANRPAAPIHPEPISLFQSEFPDPPGTIYPTVTPGSSLITVEDSIAKADSSIALPVSNEKTSQFESNAFHPEKTEIPEKFKFTRMVASRLKFKLDHTITTLDNGLLFGGLNSYAGDKRGYEYPPAGFLIKGQIKDLFEDYAIEGGVRIPTDFNGTEYFLTVDDNKKRIDKRFGIYRQTRFVTESVNSILSQRRRNRTSIAVAQWKYPFDTYQSMRLSATLRFDRSVILSTDPSNLLSDPTTAQRAGLKGEYVYDNTTPIDVNRFTGTRAKAYIEAVKKMDIQIVDSWHLNLAKGFMTVAGFDARHYIGLDRKSILAFRLSGATSFGSENILFYLGGVNNWLTPKYDEDTPIPNDKNYAYYGLGADLRGFKQNIRNGTSYILFNTELRIPILQYLFGHELRSLFLRNLQIVGFADAGSAWFGNNPFDQKSPLNTTTVSNPKVKVDLIYARDPLVVGYGTGLRLSLMGYQVRADYAWGIETREVLKPKFYLALGADF